MKTNYLAILLIITGLILISSSLFGQKKMSIEKYLESLPQNLKLVEQTPQKYLMTTEYFNKDIYGNFANRVKVTGEYTRRLKDEHVRWNNVFIAHSNNQTGAYPDSTEQEYMENITYSSASALLEGSFFKSFDKNIDNVYARNLIWDTKAIEDFAWNYFDLLQPNETYLVPDIHGSFEMAEIGNYNHNNIKLDWIGIAMMNDKLCAVIEYRALDNKLELHTNTMKSKGSELYWGKTWVSLENKQIEYAVMYSNTVQEMEIEGLQNKILANTLRELKFERIR